MIDLTCAESFADVITFLRSARRRGTATYSYQQLADKLGYRSPRSVAMVHKGQRPPSRALVKKVIQHFARHPFETEIISLLAEKAVAHAKQLQLTEIDEQLLRLKCSAQKFAELSDLDSDVDVDVDRVIESATVFLNSNDVKHVRKLFRVFLVETTSLYSQRIDGKRSYRLRFELRDETE